MPPKKKIVKKAEPKPPKNPRLPIPDDQIQSLIDRYAAPLPSMPDDDTAAIWASVAQLKSWMEKKSQNKALGLHVDPHNFSSDFIGWEWQKLKGILDDAAQENNLSAFDEFSKAWQELEISKPKQPSKFDKFDTSKPKPQVRDSFEQASAWNRKIAENISNLITGHPTNKPNSPRKIEFLKAILDLQRKWERAPTRREIEERTGIKKNKVSELVREMELDDLLTSVRRKKSPLEKIPEGG